LVGEPVTVIRPGASGGVDEYNRPVPGADVEHVESGAAFAPAGSTVQVAPGRYSVIDTDTLYFPRPGVDIVVGDRVRSAVSSVTSTATRPGG
jgi:hypothetical protein